MHRKIKQRNNPCKFK